MKKIIYVGLSGPTYYDYTNQANKTNNDELTSPNPLLENVFGLAIFYDEIWFLCESLCPASLRGHHKVIYLDQNNSILNEVSKIAIKKILGDVYKTPNDDMREITRGNFKDYWEKVDRLGINWWSNLGHADNTTKKLWRVDNHTHKLNIFDDVAYANSNSVQHLLLDLEIVRVLGSLPSVRIDIELNSFTKNIYKSLFPTTYDPTLDVHDDTQLSTYIIRAEISNSMNIHGPCYKTFDLIYESSYVNDFRNYITNQKFDDANLVYKDVIAEIDQSVKDNIQNTARLKQIIPGLVNIVIQGVAGFTGFDTAFSIGKYYKNFVQQGNPIGAAAFLLDLK